MSGLLDIGVRVETAASGFVPAVLREIETLLAALADRGEPSSIDLRSLPLAPGDLAALVAALGDGEVSAEVQALGLTQVRETGIAGVWWVTHANADGQVLAELIEVARVPEILEVHPEDLRAGLGRLRTLRTARGDDDGR
jgi:hydrogenase-1 operon protein HyaF